MDLAALPDDFFVTASQFTRKVYRDQYPSVDPTARNLSQAGKVIVITGASQGLGRQAFAVAFAKARPKAIVLIARNAVGLEAAAAEVHAINLEVKVLTQAMDVCDQSAVKDLFARVQRECGAVDVLINNAGSGKSALPIKDIDPEDFWTDFEVNVKGSLLMTQSFMQTLGADRPGTIINITSGAATATIPTTSSYALSKLIQIQMQRFVAVENPNVTAVSLHPGTVHTSITKPAFVKFSRDTMALAGGVAVWLASGEKAWLNGKYVAVNWDVEELEVRKDEIVKQGLLGMELQGKFGGDQFR